MFHRSENLFLRPAWIEDAQAITAGIGEEMIVSNLARAPWPYTLEGAVEFLSRPHEDGLPNFALTLPGQSGAPLIGMCGLHEREDGVEIGYWIARKWWGRGFATEAARSVVKIACALGINRIHAAHFVDNMASGKVLTKAGFTHTGEIRPLRSLARDQDVLTMQYVLDLGGDTLCELKRAA